MKKQVRIVTTPMLAKDLKPGDLFSIQGPEYWDQFGSVHDGCVGASVYIRTHEPATSAPDSDLMLYKINIDKHELIDQE